VVFNDQNLFHGFGFHSETTRRQISPNYAAADRELSRKKP
jgi:hypothetical protein